MMIKNYIPNPLANEEIKLPADLLHSIEIIARNVHEEWAKKRIEEGWKYGPKRDDTRKLHPSLIPYNDLSDEEKEYDRQTALCTLRMVISLGYQIIGNEQMNNQ